MATPFPTVLPHQASSAPASPLPTGTEAPLAGSGDTPPAPLAFPDVRKRHADQVDRWVRFSGVEQKDCADVVQEAWMRIAHALPSYRPDRPIEPWLCTIVRHVARDHQRRPYVRYEVLVPLAGEPPVVDVEPRAEMRLECEALLEQVLAAVPDDEWEVFVLVEIEGLSAPRVAEALEIPTNTVYSRLRRARARIAAMIARMEAEDRRRSGMFVGPVFWLSWRERWSRFWGWLRGRFVLGAVTGGAIVYWLLRPAGPAGPAGAQGPADRGVPGVTESPRGAEGLPAASTEPAVVATNVAATGGAENSSGRDPVPTTRPAAAKTRAVPAPGPGIEAKTGGTTSDGELSAATVAALGAAQALLRNGACEEASQRLAPHADQLARGPLAREYEEIQRRLRACPR